MIDDLEPFAAFNNVIVNLIVVDGNPKALPPSQNAYVRANGTDTVKFQSARSFAVRFKGESPFDWREKNSTEEGNQHVAFGTVRSDTLGQGVTMKGFEYGITVDGHTVDPEVVVRKDPMG